MATKNKHKERSHRSYKYKDIYKNYVRGTVKFPPIAKFTDFISW